MLKTFLDKYIGRLVFILGAGPSLRKVNIKLLKSHIIIAVNSSILKTPFAQYFFSCDARVTLFKSWLILKNLQCILILKGKTDGGFGVYDKKTGIDAFEGIIKKRIFYFDRKDDWIIEKSDKLLFGKSSVHCAIHFAYILGCSPIVLLGCDCQTEEGKIHFYNFPGESEGDLIKPEFRPFFINDYNNIAGALGSVFQGWRDLKRMNPKIDIINASGGILDVFPRMSLEGVIKKYER